MRNIEERKQYFFVIRELTAREIKRKYARSFLGILWSVLNPLLYMIVMSLIFSTLFHSMVDKFPTYFLTAYIFWTLFSSATSTAMTTFVDNQNMFQKTKLPRQIFVISRVYTSLINFGFSFIPFVTILIVYRIPVTWTSLIFFVDVIFALMFSAGISYIMATIYVFNRDVKFIYSNFLILYDHLIAMYYPITMLKGGVRTFVEYNPLYIYIRIARECILYNTVSNIRWFILMIIWGVGSLLVGMTVFKFSENEMLHKL